ncbi:MAG: flagellar assembly protein T N-terminal domain-containing protein [Syntrophales bacterium]|nr:flagellar assembly protein T N-terminal domain-containing protein [Syntrophales bacterium]
MTVFIVFLFTIMVFYPSLSPGEERERTQVLETEGIAVVIGSDLARARDGAIRDALQKAVMGATGQWLTPQDAERKYEILRERIYDRAEEYTQDFRILFEISDQDIYSVTVRATVFSDRIRKDLQELALINPPVQNPSVTRIFLTIRGIRTYSAYVRLRGMLKESISGIRGAVPREASWGSARFDIAVEGTAAALAERLRETLAADIQHQSDQFLELNLR